MSLMSRGEGKMPSRQPASCRRYKMLAVQFALLRAADCNVINLYWLIGAVIRVASHACDLLHQRHAGFIALTEDGVAAVQTCIGNFGDEKLRAIGIGTSIRIGHAPRTIELEVGRGFILESIAGVAGSSAHRVATLDHEVRDHAVEDGAVVKRNTVLFLMSDGTGPILGSVSQASEVSHADRSLVREKRAGQFACRGINYSSRPARSRCRFGLGPQRERGQKDD